MANADLLNIYKVFTVINKQPEKIKYEVTNCVERWIIARYNNIPKADSKLQAELKSVRGMEKNLVFVISSILASTADKIIGKEMSIDRDANLILITVTQIDHYGIQSKFIFTVAITARIVEMFEKYEEEVTLDTTYRYLPLMVSMKSSSAGHIQTNFAGQQWCISYEYSDILCKKFGIRNEAFASPFNARLFSKKGADYKYYSIFNEDVAVGSSGNFFEIKLTNIPDGNFMLNPPYIESIMENAVKFMIEILEYCRMNDVDKLFFVLLPKWDDAAALQIMRKSKFLKHEQEVEFNYYDHSDLEITAKFKKVYFILDNYKTRLNDYSLE